MYILMYRNHKPYKENKEIIKLTSQEATAKIRNLRKRGIYTYSSYVGDDWTPALNNALGGRV